MHKAKELLNLGIVLIRSWNWIQEVKEKGREGVEKRKHFYWSSTGFPASSWKLAPSLWWGGNCPSGMQCLGFFSHSQHLFCHWIEPTQEEKKIYWIHSWPQTYFFKLVGVVIMVKDQRGVYSYALRWSLWFLLKSSMTSRDLHLLCSFLCFFKILSICYFYN